MKIPITKPYFDSKEEKAVLKVLRSGWHTQGPQVEELERKFASYVGSKYAIAVTNCTAALHLALIIGGVKEKDEVIVPSFSFVATANMIPQVGATPVFADVSADTFNIDIKDINRKITKKTKAIIAVDQIGLACDYDEIKKIARRHKLLLIADAACALGASYKGKMVGSLADITCFSLHPRKVVSTGEGGMITTNSKKFSELAKLWRNHGMSLDDRARHNMKKMVYKEYLVPGFNYRMTDIQGAIGIEQMKKLPNLLKKRKKLAERYSNQLSKSPYLDLPVSPKEAPHTWQTYLIKLKDNAPISTRKLMQKLLDDGIGVKRGIMAAHLEPVYKNKYGKTKLHTTEKLIRQSFCIPLFPEMTKVQQDYIVNKIFKHLK